MLKKRNIKRSISDLGFSVENGSCSNTTIGNKLSFFGIIFSCWDLGLWFDFLKNEMTN